jgi:hypothetical protein
MPLRQGLAAEMRELDNRKEAFVEMIEQVNVGGSGCVGATLARSYS